MGQISIDVATAGDNLLAAAPGVGREIEVLGWSINGQGGANTYQFNNGVTTFGGELDARNTANSRFSSNRDGWFRIGENLPLNIDLNVSTQVSGFLSYRLLRV